MAEIETETDMAEIGTGTETGMAEIGTEADIGADRV
jgi:hypothetical protein